MSCLFVVVSTLCLIFSTLPAFQVKDHEGKISRKFIKKFIYNFIWSLETLFCCSFKSLQTFSLLWFDTWVQCNGDKHFTFQRRSTFSRLLRQFLSGGFPSSMSSDLSRRRKSQRESYERSYEKSFWVFAFGRNVLQIMLLDLWPALEWSLIIIAEIKSWLDFCNKDNFQGLWRESWTWLICSVFCPISCLCSSLCLSQVKSQHSDITWVCFSRELGWGRGLWPGGDEAHRPDLPHHEDPEDLQAGQAHHWATDTRHDSQEQVRSSDQESSAADLLSLSRWWISGVEA